MGGTPAACKELGRRDRARAGSADRCDTSRVCRARRELVAVGPVTDWKAGWRRDGSRLPGEGVKWSGRPRKEWGDTATFAAEAPVPLLSPLADDPGIHPRPAARTPPTVGTHAAKDSARTHTIGDLPSGSDVAGALVVVADGDADASDVRVASR